MYFSVSAALQHNFVAQQTARCWLDELSDVPTVTPWICTQVTRKSSVVVSYCGQNVDSALGSRKQIRIYAVEACGVPISKEM